MRKSGIELLRILAMMMIVVYHLLRWCYSPGASALWFTGAETWPEALIGAGGSWGVNLFLLVGTWFLVDAEFSWKRPLRLYLTLIMYTIPLTIVPLLAGFDVSSKSLFRGFCPFFGRALWFVSAYISLIVLSPFLKKIFALPRTKLAELVAILTVLIAGVCSLPDIQDAYFCNFVWFIYVYILMGWLKRSTCLEWLVRHKTLCLCSGLAIYVALVLVAHFRWPGGALAAQYLYDPKGLPNLLSALLVFIFFAHWELGSIAVVNRVAKASLAVYIVHQTPAFFPFLAERLMRLEAGRGCDSLARILLLTAVLYGVVLLVDMLRDYLTRRVF